MGRLVGLLHSVRWEGKLHGYLGSIESITHPPPPDFLDSFRVGLRNPSDISPELFSWVPRPSRLYDIASVALASRDGLQDVDKYARISALLLDANFWTAEMVDDLSLGFRAVVSEVIAVIRRFPIPNLDKSLSELIGREDMRMMAPDTNKRLDYKDMCEWKKWSPWRNLEKPITFPTINPVPHFWKKPSSPPSQPVHTQNIRFSKDRRLEDVARILQYIEPVTLSVPSLQQDHNIPSRTNTYMGHLALRTLSLQLGFAMYTFRSRMAPEEGMVDKFALKTPICLFARLLPGKSLTKYEDPSLKKEWPTFHHGVASALMSIYPSDLSDIPVTSLHATGDRDPAHGGALLGMGLAGLMRRMTKFQAFRHLTEKENFTTIGILLGLSASHIGTESPDVLSVLLPFMPAFHPPDSIASALSPIVQSSALLGLGLLNLGSGKKRLADTMLRILSGITLSTTYNADACTEAYALSAGLAFGMIMIAKGAKTEQPGDVGTLKTFRKLIGDFEYSPILDRKKKPETVIDVNITSPAATIALGLMYFNTGRKDIINILEIPDSKVRLDYVRSDLVLLRTLARHLVMWEDISPSIEWINKSLPPLLAPRQDGMIWRDTELLLANWCIRAGSAFAMGLKFAGTGSHLAFTALKGMCAHFRAMMPQIRGRSLDATTRRHALRTCSNIAYISLCLVMAGTGNVEVHKKLRELHGIVGELITYGQHVAHHLALGLLYLGGGRYTVGTSPASIAVLIAAFFPIFPKDPSDNRAYIQAYRHLWVLAAEPRFVSTRSTDGSSVGAPIPIRVWTKDAPPPRQNWSAFNPIPELRHIKSISINGSLHFPNSFQPDPTKTNGYVYRSFLRNRTVYATPKRNPEAMWLPELDNFPFFVDESLLVEAAKEATVQAVEEKQINDHDSLLPANVVAYSLWNKFRRHDFTSTLLRSLIQSLATDDSLSLISPFHSLFDHAYDLSPTLSNSTTMEKIIQARHSGFLMEFYVSSGGEGGGELKTSLFDRYIRFPEIDDTWGRDKRHDKMASLSLFIERELENILVSSTSSRLTRDFITFLTSKQSHRYPADERRRADLLTLLWKLNVPTSFEQLEGMRKAVEEMEGEWEEKWDAVLAERWGMRGGVSFKVLREGWRMARQSEDF
ncbi:hypothetical protein BT69DRAFT_368248 [Atractiella rhizophila]|nr:hypothetical protein BT69DRAFT_368248 [Atractiella rhizophila]